MRSPQGYTSTAQVNNPFDPPTVPELRALYARRAALMGEKNGRFKHGRGRARRHRREIDTRGGLLRLRGLAEGVVRFADRDGRRWTLGELLAVEIGKDRGFARSVQYQVRRAWAAMLHHGPASGWAVAQPVRDGDGADKWTPYVVPKAGEKCWRWWRRMRLLVARLAPMLARLLGDAIPLHRGRLEQTTEGRRAEQAPALTPSVSPRYRDRTAEPIGALLDRLQLRFGM